MDNEVMLTVDKTLTKLAGNKYGCSIYEKQVKNKIILERNFLIVFPTQVDDIASSFIQGFFSNIVDTIGIKELKEKMQVESSIPRLKDFIIENLI